MVDSIISILGLFFDNPRQVFHFLVTGVINTIFGFSVYSIFIYIGMGYFISSSAAMVLGAAFNYRTIKVYVFGKSQKASPLAFGGCYLAVLAITVLLLEALGTVGTNPYVAGFLVSPPMAIFSYFLQKQFVFRKPNDEQ